MKLATLQTASGPEVVAVETIGAVPRFIPLNRIDTTLPRSLRSLLAEDPDLSRSRRALQQGLASHQTVEGQLLAPIPDPGKVLCIGLNYREHAVESRMEIPSEPICFSKFSSAVIGPEEAIQLPPASNQVDYEAELVAVIGRRAKHVSVGDALSYVAGYCNGNDVSARDWQIGRPGKQWLLGKTPDTFAPIGPCLVTADEAGNPHDLAISLRLNGETMQQCTTKEFIFGVDAVIAHVSQLITLEPGDLIFTGTPSGVGMGRSPQVWLKAGDTVEVEIEGLGTLRNPVTG
ncbi:fumarylacetoacetate hydrolase family protein [Planctomicrobium sp. SH664]|uniref:fumarylacetoacetate hydrolase family protein n=1 Tax=Planctomicrobium sp. SH664 TaxID=3448125 RepID=UPI003F5B0F37